LADKLMSAAREAGLPQDIVESYPDFVISGAYNIS